MKRAVIEFSGTLTVYPDGDEYEGGGMSEREAANWVYFAMERGDKHAGSYTTYARPDGPVVFEEYDEDE